MSDKIRMSDLEANVKASAVMEFVEMVKGAYCSGFVDNHPTVYDVYRMGQNHVKDNYGIETEVWNDELAKESRADTYRSTQDAITKLEADKAELVGTLISIRATQLLVGDLSNLDDLIAKHKKGGK